ncbi:MAG: hypothetical protein ABIJ65_11850 [Chloroflexota bacterium]
MAKQDGVKSLLLPDGYRSPRRKRSGAAVVGRCFALSSVYTFMVNKTTLLY